jgi:WD40 repeat protein
MTSLLPLLLSLTPQAPTEVPLAELLEAGAAVRLGTPARFESGPISVCSFTEAGLLVGSREGASLVLVDPTGEAADRRLQLDPPSGVPILAGRGGQATLLGPLGVLRQVSLEDGSTTHSWPKLDFVHTALAVSADGRIGVGTNLMVEQLDVFDLATHEPLPGVPIGDHWTRVLALSPDGGLVALGDLDGRLRVLDRVSGEVLLEAAEVEPTGLAFRPDGKTLCVGSTSDITLVDTTTWEAYDGVSGWEEDVLVPRFGPEGDEVFFGTDFGSIYGLDVTSGEVTFWASLGDGAITALDLDGGLLAAGDDVGGVRIFDLASGEQLLSPQDAHGEPLWSLDWGPQGPVSIAGDLSLCFWDLERGGAVRVEQDSAATEVVALAGGGLLTGGDGGPLVRASADGKTASLAPGEWYASCFATTEGKAWVGDWDGVLKAVDLETGEVVAEVAVAEEVSIFELTLLADGQLAACGLEDGSVAVVDLAKHELLGAFVLPELEPEGQPEGELTEEEQLEQLLESLGYLADGGGSWCTGVADAGDGRVLLGRMDGRAAVLEARTGALVVELEVPTKSVLDVAGHAASGHLAVAHEGGVVLYDRGGAQLRSLTTDHPVQAVTFAPDGTQLALGLFDGTVVVLELSE